MSKTTFTVGDDNKTLTVERTFRTTKARIWDAYTKPELLAQWWGPNGWETEIKFMEFKVGGYWHYCMRCTDKSQGDYFGMESWGKATYTEIEPKDSFSYSDEFCNDKAEAVPGMPVSQTKVEFTEESGNTHLLSVTTYATAEELKQVLEMGMEEGFTQTLDRLDAFVSG